LWVFRAAEPPETPTTLSYPKLRFHSNTVKLFLIFSVQSNRKPKQWLNLVRVSHGNTFKNCNPQERSMKSNSKLMIGIIIALLVVCGLCIITAFGTYSSIESNNPGWEWFICAGTPIT